MRSRSRTTTALSATALVLVATAVTLLPGAAPEAAADTLTPYAGCDELLTAYREALERSATPPDGPSVLERLTGAVVGARSDEAQSGSAGGPAPTSARSEAAQPFDAVGTGPTGTNVQERGVDEPDSAKRVGDLLLALSEDRLQVVRAGAQPEALASLSLGRSAYGAELLVEGDRVLVLLPGDSGVVPSLPGGPAEATGLARPATGATGTTLLLVDLAEPSAPRLLESLELDGRYVSARSAGGVVRLVTSSTPSLPTPSSSSSSYEEQVEDAQRAARAATLEQVLPQAVRRAPDGRVLSTGPAVDCGQVRHAGPVESAGGTLLVTTLDLSAGLAALDSTGVSTDGDLVYATADRLYAATSRWSASRWTAPDGGEVTTELHAFDTRSPTATRYAGTTSVSGYVYGRWALSSYGGHLRVATTQQAPLSGSPSSSLSPSVIGPGTGTSSSITVLAEREDGLVETGRVDGLGPDEQIYAVRYAGPLATVVTFRQTDPLYVVDLADPAAPALLGELKVPGFSTYLHPVGDDRLLAVGQDADSTGRVTGLQLSLFDLSDRSAPALLDRLPLGRSATPASSDSRAFGYDPAQRLALMPLVRDDGRTGRSEALGVRVTAQGTLEQAGRLAAGPGASEVERVLSDGERVYAVSRTGLVAGTVGDLSPTGSVTFLRR